MSNIFFNEAILSGYRDYAIGGIFVNEDEPITYNTIYFGVKEKLRHLIDDYYTRAYAASMEAKISFDAEEITTQLKYMVEDNFHVLPEYNNTDGFVYTIMNSDKMVKWMDETIKERVNYYFQVYATNNVDVMDKGISNMALEEKIKETEAFQEALDTTTNITLEEFIEQLSSIEL
jgi:hypothetical protein